MPHVQRFGTLRARSVHFNEDGTPYLDLTIEAAGFTVRGIAPQTHAKAFGELASARPGDRIWFWGPREAAPTQTDADGTLVVAQRAKVTVRQESPADGAPIAGIKGVGPAMLTRLQGVGIVTLEDLAALDDREAQALDAAVSPVRGALLRHDVVGQARGALGSA